MDVRRLQTLVELSRRGTMRAVAEATGYGTSAVSQQLATLEREVGATLFVPEGRRVRLTPAGRRLVAHAERVLAAVAAALVDLDPDAEPHGDLRVGSYATAMRRWVVPAVGELAVSHPLVRPALRDCEPDEVRTLLADDQIDLGLLYDYDLVPAARPTQARLLGRTTMALAVPATDDGPRAVRSTADLATWEHRPWITNSRGSDDDELARRLCALDGWAPEVRHQADDLGLVMAMVAAGLGVALIAEDAPPVEGARLVPVTVVALNRRTWGITRPGEEAWPAAALLLDRLAERMAAG